MKIGIVVVFTFHWAAAKNALSSPVEHARRSINRSTVQGKTIVSHTYMYGSLGFGLLYIRCSWFHEYIFVRTNDAISYGH